MRLATIVALLAVTLSLVAPCVADTPPPGLMFSTVLNGVKYDPDGGEIWLHQVQALFLPTPQSEARSGYSPDGDKLWAILSQVDGEGEGTPLHRADFYAEELRDDYWLLGSHRWTDLGAEEADPTLRAEIEPGEYTLDFHLEAGRFYTYPFTVAQTGDTTSIDGDWSDWGYLYYRDADPEQNIQWKAWLRYNGPEQTESTKVRIGVMRESENNKLIATARPNRTLTLRNEWVRYEFDLIEPMQGTGGGRQLQAKDILIDGDYALKMVVNDEDYGLWRFTVEGGKPKPAGRTIRGEADPLTFVEGGADAFWYGRAE